LMKAFFDKASDILQKAEPFFRLIEVVLVVFGTIFVSCQANDIARQANAIAEMQLDVSKDENQPNFIITQVLEPDSHGSENANSVLYLYNTGATLYNLDVDLACIIELNFIDTNNMEVVKHFFSLDDFYLIGEVSRNTQGLLLTRFCEGNWKKFFKLYQDVLHDDRLDSGYIVLSQYVKISYEDIYGEKHTNYYTVDGIRQTLITQEVGEQAFRQYNENLNVIHTDTMSVDELLKKIA